MSEEELQQFARKGGKAGGRARALKLSATRRSEIARAAARARWDGRKQGTQSIGKRAQK